MGDRRLAGVLALAGAVLLCTGCLLPYSSQDGSEFEIFQRHNGYSGQLYNAVEPAAVIIVAATLGLLLLLRPLRQVWSGVLIASGAQTALMWVGYVGYTLAASYPAHAKAGGWVGMAGSLIIAAGGVAAFRASAGGEALAPAGWYTDPAGGDGLRYWSGSFWTEHTSAGATPP
jgi:hypothetical protein